MDGPHLPTSRRALVAALSLTLTACSGAAGQDDPRTAELLGFLFEDNRDLLHRAPHRVSEKLAKMAADPHAFLRGTTGLYISDQLDTGSAGAPTRFGTQPGDWIRIAGDPHLENFGSFEDDGRLAIELNDFDASTWAPFHLDVRRLAGSYVVLADLSPGHLGAFRDALPRRVAEAYVDELRALHHGRTGRAFEYADVPGGIGAAAMERDVLRRARRDGRARALVHQYSQLVNGVRTFRLGAIERRLDPAWAEDELVAVMDDERALVAAAMTNYPGTLRGWAPPPLELVDVARRLGAGVSSYPLDRFYVLVRAPGADPSDDILLELKEARDAPSIPLAVLAEATRFASNAARAVDAQRALQSSSTRDRWLGVASAGDVNFRVRERTGFQKSFGVDRTIEDLDARDLRPPDVVEAAELMGRLLAQTHARSSTPGGVPGLEVLAPLFTTDDDVDAFAVETAAAALRTADGIHGDLARLRASRALHGPLLGFDQHLAASGREHP